MRRTSLVVSIVAVIAAAVSIAVLWIDNDVASSLKPWAIALVAITVLVVAILYWRSRSQIIFLEEEVGESQLEQSIQVTIRNVAVAIANGDMMSLYTVIGDKKYTPLFNIKEICIARFKDQLTLPGRQSIQQLSKILKDVQTRIASTFQPAIKEYLKIAVNAYDYHVWIPQYVGAVVMDKFSEARAFLRDWVSQIQDDVKFDKAAKLTIEILDDWILRTDSVSEDFDIKDISEETRQRVITERNLFVDTMSERLSNIARTQVGAEAQEERDTEKKLAELVEENVANRENAGSNSKFVSTDPSRVNMKKFR